MKVLLRRDSIENWYKHNPVLLEGEPALVHEKAGNSLIIGDGKTKFSDLQRIRLVEQNIYIEYIDGRFVLRRGEEK